MESEEEKKKRGLFCSSEGQREENGEFRVLSSADWMQGLMGQMSGGFHSLRIVTLTNPFYDSRMNSIIWSIVNDLGI